MNLSVITCLSLDVFNYENAPRTPIVINGNVNGFVKSYKNFSFYNILYAGHMVPYGNYTFSLEYLTSFVDNGATALHMFKSVIGAKD